MRKYLLAALSATVLATPAFAQDGGPFSGFRVEAITGFDKLQSGEAEDDADTSDDEGDESVEGLLYGVGVGFDIDSGNIVFGAEGEYSDSSGNRDFDESIDGITGSFDTGRDLYIGGRVGFKASPRTLVYAKAGYTNLSLEVEGTDGTVTASADTEVDGLRLGAGAEFLFGTNLYGKLEYRYSNYTDAEFEFGDTTVDLGDIDVDRHQVAVGLGFRF